MHLPLASVAPPVYRYRVFRSIARDRRFWRFALFLVVVALTAVFGIVRTGGRIPHCTHERIERDRHPRDADHRPLPPLTGGKNATSSPSLTGAPGEAIP